MRKKITKHPKIKKLNHEELSALIARARSNTLTEDDCNNIEGMGETIAYIIDLLAQKDVKLKRLLKQLLGIKSEKTKKVLSEKDTDSSDKENPPKENQGAPDEQADTQEKNQNKKGKGHGRNGVEKYTGAEHIFIPHDSLKHKDPCPECPKGKVYTERKPGIFIYIEGKSPLTATVYELEKFRCNLCGAIFQANLPVDVPNDSKNRRHYDETAKSMITILRYGYGLPLNRLSNLQADLGIPLAATTGWDKSEDAANKIYPVYEELKRQGAQGDIIHNDDTGMKVLKVMQEIEQEVKDAEGKKIRTGIFTTGIISIIDDLKIALFFTGRQHAGENFGDLLEMREADRSPPIQMCDAKNGNTPSNVDVITCNCNVHARRYFVDIAHNYPDQCTYVIVNVYKEIYKNDAIAKEKNMSPDERLAFHKEKSGPIMSEFHIWLNRQFEERLAEPNSSLGEAISYVLNHWTELTQFLRVAGAVLDNNICEQGIKMLIYHRKNSLFYKTMHGAYIGDMFMSLIHTCNLNDINPFDYLTELQRHSSKLFKNPHLWMPWNYKETLETLSNHTIDMEKTDTEKVQESI